MVAIISGNSWIRELANGEGTTVFAYVKKIHSSLGLAGAKLFKKD